MYTSWDYSRFLVSLEWLKWQISAWTWSQLQQWDLINTLTQPCEDIYYNTHIPQTAVRVHSGLVFNGLIYRHEASISLNSLHTEGLQRFLLYLVSFPVCYLLDIYEWEMTSRKLLFKMKFTLATEKFQWSLCHTDHYGIVGKLQVLTAHYHREGGGEERGWCSPIFNYMYASPKHRAISYSRSSIVRKTGMLIANVYFCEALHKNMKAQSHWSQITAHLIHWDVGACSSEFLRWKQCYSVPLNISHISMQGSHIQYIYYPLNSMIRWRYKSPL